MTRTFRLRLAAVAAMLAMPAALHAQARPTDSLALSGLRWREIGPFRGGRSVAVTGSVARPQEYWMGTVGGGVFKSNDGGQSWGPVTDRYFGGSIGAVEVSPSSPDVVYVGGGEYPIRGNVAHGDGVWKTTNGGRTWTSLGLRETRHIADIVIHPTNPDLVYVAALGHVFAPNVARGIYRSKDGGKSWDKILFRNDSTGAIDLVMDPSDPNVLYAAFWQAGRTPWMLTSGGVGSGIFKTTDGGDHWTEITRNPGLPATGLIGNIGLSVSAANPKRVYAIIEHDSGGVFRSDDAGATWTRLNTDRSLRQRAWYYTKIHADPKNQDVVYVNNVSFMKSTDGGKTFRPVRGIPHGDSHDFWIAPDNANRMIEGDDGGASVSTDGGRTWTDEDFATAQFYHVSTTNHFPYKVCGAQQDNSTMCGPSRREGAISITDWQDAGGGESGYVEARKDDPDIVYAGSYGGLLTRKDMRTGLERNVNPWPDNPMGHSAIDLKYRFQWTFPIVTSKHAPGTVYMTSQHVHMSRNGGESWTTISPDLSYNDPKTLGPSGGPITKDQTSVEYYAVVFSLAESPLRAGELWAGTDDGRVHVTRNNGATWTEVTPKDMQKYSRVSSIEVSRHAPGTVYVTANRYQLDDFRPYAWKTTNYGATWTRIDAGIPNEEFLRVIREDDEKPGLLYAGTERGVWASANGGANWHSLQLNLPPVPVHDLALKEGDLVAATHGRSFWILDNLSSLRQASAAVFAKDAHLFKPRDAYRVSFGGGRFGGGGGAPAGPQDNRPGAAPAKPVGANPPSGALVQFWLAKPAQEVALEFLDPQGRLIRTYTSRQDSASAADSVKAAQRTQQRVDSLKAAGMSDDSARVAARRLAAESGAVGGGEDEGFARTQPVPRVPNRAGVNTFSWNMRYPDPTGFRGLIMWAGGLTGPMAPPGSYTVRMLVNGMPVGSQTFRLLGDPRVKGVTQADYDAQFALLQRIAERTNAANDAVKTIRYVRREVDARRAKVPEAQRAAFDAHARALLAEIASVEDSLYQTKNRSGQDPLNYPIRLNNRMAALAGVVGSSAGRPTKQSYEVFDVVATRIGEELTRMHKAFEVHLAPINALLPADRKITPRAVDVGGPGEAVTPSGEDEDADK